MPRPFAMRVFVLVPSPSRRVLQVAFDHWECMGDPFVEGSIDSALVRAIRIRKGLPPDVPPVSNYIDKL